MRLGQVAPLQTRLVTPIPREYKTALLRRHDAPSRLLSGSTRLVRRFSSFVVPDPAALAVPPPGALYHSAACSCFPACPASPDPVQSCGPDPLHDPGRSGCAREPVANSDNPNLLLPARSCICFFWRWVPGSAFSCSSSRGCWPGLYEFFHHFSSFVAPGGRVGFRELQQQNYLLQNVVLFGPRDADAHSFSAGTFFPLTFPTMSVEVKLHVPRIFELLSYFVCSGTGQ